MNEHVRVSVHSSELLAQMLLKHVPEPGLCQLSVPGLQAFRSDGKIGRAPCVYEPCIVMVLQGSKRAYLADQSFDYTPDNYVVFSVPMPMESEIIGATPEKPFVALAMTIEPAIIADLQTQIEDEDDAAEADHQSIILSGITAEMHEALHRLLSALDDQTDARVLGPMVRNEIYYRVLQGNQGSILRAVLQRHGHYNRISQVLRAIQSDCAAELTTADMARMANMSKTLLHDSFKAITTLTPLQYVKTIRLHRARTLMLNDGASARTAASAVGSGSASQFSREFKRLVGYPPSMESQSGEPLNLN
ncbi:MAG: AraC family transcriptional regulator [Pseudomonadota bacterium]